MTDAVFTSFFPKRVVALLVGVCLLGWGCAAPGVSSKPLAGRAPGANQLRTSGHLGPWRDRTPRRSADPPAVVAGEPEQKTISDSPQTGPVATATAPLPATLPPPVAGEPEQKSVSDSPQTDPVTSTKLKERKKKKAVADSPQTDVVPTTVFVPVTPPPAAVEAGPGAAETALPPTGTGQHSSLEDYPIGRDDILQVTIFNIPPTEEQVLPRMTEVQVSQRGVVSMPLLGEIQAMGLTASALESGLREKYRKYIRDPQIGVRVMSAGKFFVDGAVRKPGSYPFDRAYTLTQALAAAGGVDFNLAQNSDITVFRQNGTQSQTIAFDLNKIRSGEMADPQMQSGDVVVVFVSTPKYVLDRFLGILGVPAPLPTQ